MSNTGNIPNFNTKELQERSDLIIKEQKRMEALLKYNKDVVEATINFNAVNDPNWVPEDKQNDNKDSSFTPTPEQKQQVNSMMENINKRKTATQETETSTNKEDEKVVTIEDKINESKSSAQVDLSNIIKTQDNKEEIAEKTEDKKETEELIKAKVLLKEANDIAKESEAVNNKDYEWEEKATWTDGPKIDINKLLNDKK